MGQRGAGGIFACDLGGSAGIVILIGGLVAATVGAFLIAGGVSVDRVGGGVAAGIRFADKVIAGGIVAEGTIEGAELAVCEGGFGEGGGK